MDLISRESNAQKIEECLHPVALFSALEALEVRALAEQSEIVTFRIGQEIVKAGETPTGLYLIVSGRARVVTSRSGKEYVVTTRTDGEYFGVEAVVGSKVSEYTVRAASDILTAISIPARALADLLEKRPDLKRYFDMYLSDVSLRAFLKLFSLFTPLRGKQLNHLLTRLEEKRYEPGTYIFRDGDPGDAFYILREGRVEVLKERDGRSVRLQELKTGDFFGELALLEEAGTRTASVRCLEAVDVFRMDRTAFDELAHDPEVRQRLQDVVRHYHLDRILAEKYKAHGDQDVVLDMAPPADLPAATPAPAPEADRPRPVWHMFGRYPFIRQHDESDCGAASLGMILRYYGSNLGLSRLRDVANVNREGATLLSLAEAAEELGFHARPVRADYGTLLQAELPAIVHWGGNHYIVLYQARPNKVLVADPDRGLIHMSAEEFRKGWTGYMLQLTPTTSLAKVEDQVSPFQRFLPLIWQHRGTLLQIFLASLLLDVLGLGAPIFTQIILDQVLVHHAVAMLQMILVGMILVTIFTTLVSAVRYYLLQHTSIKIDLTLIITFYRHLLKLPIDYFEKRKIGDFVSRFAEAEKVRELLTGTAITTLLDSIMVIVYLALMFYYNAQLALVLVLYVPCFAILTFGFTPYLNRKSRDMFVRHADSESLLVESINGIQTIKTLGVERGMRWRWEELKIKAVNVGLQMMMASVAIESMISVLYRASSMVVLYLGAWQVMKGALTVGQLMAFNTLMFSVIGPIGRLMGLWQQGQEARLAVERLNDVLDSEIEQTRAKSALVQLPKLTGHIKLENVSYRFGTKTDANVLTGIDLELFPGQTVAIVGRSGSGKTTLAKLLMGMYKPSEGRILVDGVDLQGIDMATYRHQLGVVAQDSFLFSGTVRENIALGDPEPDFNAVVQAATLANAHDFIGAMPLGYDTVVGERGTNLSGGQRQRISIARALYRNPRLLILDEATSALDVESEAAIQKHLKKVLADRTAIVIAHRLSTVMDADLIVVLDRGIIVETGNHKTLLEKQGLYYYLTSQQLKL